MEQSRCKESLLRAGAHCYLVFWSLTRVLPPSFGQNGYSYPTPNPIFWALRQGYKGCTGTFASDRDYNLPTVTVIVPFREMSFVSVVGRSNPRSIQERMRCLGTKLRVPRLHMVTWHLAMLGFFLVAFLSNSHPLNLQRLPPHEDASNS